MRELTYVKDLQSQEKFIHSESWRWETLYIDKDLQIGRKFYTNQVK